MDWYLLVAGALLVAATVFDVLTTTLAPSTGAGPFTNRFGRSLWRLARKASGDGERPSPLLLAGPAILVLTPFVWMSALWAGWSLIFSADPTAVVDAVTGQPADAAARAYYAGFVVFTLGTGDYVPQGGPWQIASVFAVLNGLTLVTLSITYLIPVVTAVTQRRHLAATITALGRTPQEILTTAWDGRDLSVLTTALFDVANEIGLIAQKHLAYPVLHYFHSRARTTALEPSLAALDEAVTVVRTAVPTDVAPHAAALRSMRSATQQLMDVLAIDRGAGDTEPPPRPDTAPLKAAGIPLQETSPHDPDLDDHRRRLHALVTDAAWPWDALTEPADS